MTEAQKYYEGSGGGCSCHTFPPCSFCMMLTEEEADILWNGTMSDLEKHWKSENSFDEGSSEIEL